MCDVKTMPTHSSRLRHSHTCPSGRQVIATRWGSMGKRVEAGGGSMEIELGVAGRIASIIVSYLSHPAPALLLSFPLIPFPVY